jgi:peptide subunit release factor RF-3
MRGKTTLTEKLLLFGGEIQMAGTVKGAQGDAPRDFPIGCAWSSSAVSQ